MSNRKWSDEELRQAVEASKTLSQVCRILDLSPSGRQFQVLRSHMERLELRLINDRSTCKFPSKKSLTEIMVENSSYNTGHLRRRLILEGLLEERCNECGLGSKWNGKHLVLHLDHRNGIGRDHRLENLRLLCPNCHSQTNTYSGRKKRKRNRNCQDCGVKITPGCKRCRPCSLKIARQFITNQPNVDWPSTKVLKQMVSQSSYVEVGRQLGVSDNAVRKRIKYHK